jgi:hypothetical protein
MRPTEDQSGMAPLKYPNLGFESYMLHDLLETFEYAVNLLRSGSLRLDGTRDPATMNHLNTCLIHLSEKLRPRFEGLLDALLIAHRQAGGSWSELTERSGVPLGTLRSRVKRIETEGSHWAEWARGDLNPHIVRHPFDLGEAPGFDTTNPLGQFLDHVEKQEAAAAAAERAGLGVPLGKERVSFQLGAAGSKFLDSVMPLPPAPGGPTYPPARRGLPADLMVELHPGPEGDRWWRLHLPAYGDFLPAEHILDRETAARLLAAATAEPLDGRQK